nr:PAS domain-containing sensor histidine kinase [arsenite-oxidising bacterium NT-25]
MTIPTPTPSTDLYLLLSALLKDAPQPIIVKNEESRFLYLNILACKMIGAQPDEVIGLTDYEFLPAEEADAIQAMDRLVFATGEEQHFEEEITGGDGSRRVLVTHKRRVDLPTLEGLIPVLVAVIEDVTELRTAESVLRASEEHYRSLIELHPQTPWVANNRGEVTEVGPEWEQLSGRARDDALATGWESSLHPADVRRVRTLWQRAVKDGTLFDCEFRLRTSTNGYRWFRSRAAAKVSEAGEAIRWYGLLEDVDDRQQALQALRESEAKLREHRDKLEKLVEARTEEVRQKNSELDRLLQQEREVNALQRRFVAMISHEFRTPLAIIDAAAQRLTRTKTAPSPDYLAQKAAQIKSAAARMVELMESILAAGRLETGTIAIAKQPCSVRDLILECAVRRQELSNAHRIHVDVDRIPEMMALDRAAMERVLSNLLSNAVKYAPQSPDIYIRGWQDGPAVKVSISDTGIGIDEDDLGRLFEPYFRARSANGIAGTGIGLNIVREIVELHGGTVSVASRVGEGTTFTVTLPLVGEEHSEAA